MKLLDILREKLKRYDETHNFTCDICGREVFAGERVCSACRVALPWNDKIFCPLCGRKLKEAGVCPDCKASRPQTDKARSVFTHEGEAQRLILRFKRGEKFLMYTLAELSMPSLAYFPDATTLTFVPMTARAERARGYNQSRLLTELMAKRSGLEFLACAEKIRETESQKTLGKRDRAQNLKGCFKVKDKKSVSGKRIIIIDDTLTTGATAGELATVLKRAGAEKVYLMTVTSVQNKHPFGNLEQ